VTARVRILAAIAVLCLGGCAAIPPAAYTLIGVVGGVIVETEKLDEALINAYLARKGMKAAPIAAAAERTATPPAGNRRGLDHED